MTDILGTGFTILFIILIVLVALLFLAVIVMSRSLKRMEKKYNRFMRGLDGTSLEKEFAREFRKVDDYRIAQEKVSEHINDLEKYQRSSISKYGIVKYDAFEDVGGKLSFALAMLDETDTGFVLNAIHSKDNCFLYLKEIVNGESYIMLSTEEINALRSAKEFRRDEFEERERKYPKPVTGGGENVQLSFEDIIREKNVKAVLNGEKSASLTETPAEKNENNDSEETLK